MFINDKIIKDLRDCGLKITKVRCGLIQVFQKSGLPVSESELREKLLNLGIKANKTTVYRELDCFKKNNLIKFVEFGDGKKRYELDLKEHHHHLVCIKCQKIDEVRFKNDLKLFEKEIPKQRDFKIIDHTLEFFGLCKNCKPN